MHHPPRDRLARLGLVAATFFIVSGGPYGLEEVVLGQGYRGALLLLALLPVVWSLPVALLVGELSAALPETGGYYPWVRRALGPFWGLQEAWLSLCYGVVDIALYPTLLVAYLLRLAPALGGDAPGQPGWWLALAAIGACALWNTLGIRSVGRGAIGLGLALLAPFAVLVALAALRLPQGGWAAAADALAAPAGEGGLAEGLLLAMWNLCGFDNAATFAAEVEEPQRAYPAAMVQAALLVSAMYLVTVLAGAVAGLPPAAWSTGAWVEVARRLGGPALALLVIAGGAASALGMYNALLLSWSRLPEALAQDGWLPAALGRRSPRTGAPVRALLLGAAVSAACFGLGLRRLVELDVLLYGLALVLEFAALVALRVREPGLPRPFRVPGGLAGAVLLGVPPTALLGLAAWTARAEPGGLGLSAVAVAGLVALAGPLWWCLDRAWRRRTPG